MFVNYIINHTGYSALSITVNAGKEAELRKKRLWPVLRKCPAQRTESVTFCRSTTLKSFASQGVT